MDSGQEINFQKKKSRYQIVYGALLSYVSIFIEIIIYLLTIKLLTNYLGDNYGLYTAATSIIGLFVLDFGLSESVTKFVCKYKAVNDTASERNFLGIVFKLFLILGIILFVIAIGVYFFLRPLYAGLSDADFEIFRGAYIIVAIYSVVSTPFIPLNGLLASNEEFIALKFFSLIQKILTSSLLVAAIFLNFGMYAILLSNALVGVFMIILKLLYLFFKCKERINFRYWDRGTVKALFSFSVWIALMTLSAKISLSFMPTVLGSVSANAKIQMGIFGFACTIESYTYLLSTVLSGMFLPKITRMSMSQGDSSIQATFMKVGKIQMYVVGIILAGYILFGKEFATFFVPNYSDSSSYICAIFLILGVMSEAPKVVAATHSYVKNTVKDVALIELFVSLVRLGFSYLAAKLWGAVGVSAAYFLFTLLGQLLRDHFVYHKKQGLNVLGFYKTIYLPYFLIAGVAVCLAFIVKQILPVSRISVFLLEGFVFVVFFSFLYFSFIFTVQERKSAYHASKLAGWFSKFCLRLRSRMPVTVKYFLQHMKKKIAPVFLKNSYGIPNLFCFLAILSLFFSSNYPISTLSFWVSIFFLCLSAFLFFFYRIRNNYSAETPPAILLSKLNNLVIFSTFLIVFSIFASYLYNHSSTSIYLILKTSVFFFAGAFLVYCIPFEDFRKFFVNIFFAISSISIFFYLLINIVGFNFSSQIYSNGSVSYFNYFYIFFSILGGEKRNCSIFWEPGIFASFCCVGILLETFFNKSKPSLLKLLAFSIGIITAESTAGYLLAVFMIPFLMNRYFHKKWETTTEAVFSAFLVFATMCSFILFPAFPSFFYRVLGKTTSLSTRFLSMRVDLEIFLHHFPFGVGGDYSSVFWDLVANEYPGLIDSSTSTMGYYLGAFGLMGLLFIVFLIVAIFKNKRYPLHLRFLLFSFVFLILNKEPHIYSCASIVLIYYVFWASGPKLFSSFGRSLTLQIKKVKI